MELLIGLAVIFILMLCLGVSTEIIITVALGIALLFILFMTFVFVYATVILASSKKARGYYSRFEKDGRSNIPYAYYIIDNEEYKNLFPMEVIFVKQIYREEREVKLLVYEKKKKCFDTNAVICCILGIAVSIFLLVEAAILVFGSI